MHVNGSLLFNRCCYLISSVFWAKWLIWHEFNLDVIISSELKVFRCSTTYTHVAISPRIIASNSNQKWNACPESRFIRTTDKTKYPNYSGFNQMCPAFWINCKWFFCVHICFKSFIYIFRAFYQPNKIRIQRLNSEQPGPLLKTVTTTTARTHHVNTQITITLQLIKVSARLMKIIGAMFIMHIKKVFYHYFMGVCFYG